LFLLIVTMTVAVTMPVAVNVNVTVMEKYVLQNLWLCDELIQKLVKLCDENKAKDGTPVCEILDSELDPETPICEILDSELVRL
jgi:hypothetical protein